MKFKNEKARYLINRQLKRQKVNMENIELYKIRVMYQILIDC